jgi:signal transduction histidine kinase
VQEGLTNALKHAPGAAVHVRLALHDGGLVVEVHDDGLPNRGSVLAATGSGLGLVGMRERITSHGGQLYAGSDDTGGWCLRAWLPMTVSQATEPATA